jgi:hypothetical protein
VGGSIALRTFLEMRLGVSGAAGSLSDGVMFFMSTPAVGMMAYRRRNTTALLRLA